MRSVVVLAAGFCLLVFIGPLLVPYDPTEINIPKRLSPPSSEFILGTDALGRDIFSRILHGSQWTLGLAFFISVVGLLIGTIVGLFAALGGRMVDWFIMRTTDSFLVFPDLVAAVVIVGLLGTGTWSLIFALSVIGWMRYARVVRGIGLSLKTRGYVIQAKLAGLSLLSITRWHYLPSLLSSLILVWTGMFSRAILGISALGFFGFGVQLPTSEWGTMLLDARIHMRSTPLQMIWPGVVVISSVLAINLVGDALRDAIADKKSYLQGKTS
ncbi:MAG: ABC transporter permease [Aestuariivita sp.]|nr:ABC transporter permease [Aestuariivita sp.]